MNGYLRFLKSLSQYQQRAEIARLAFTERWDGSSLEEDLLQDPAVTTYSKSLGVNPASWEFDLQHYVEEPDLIGAPVFCDDQSRAPFTFRYEHVSGKNLVITGIIYVCDNQSTLIGTLACSSTKERSCRAKRLVAAGIDPKTLDTVSHHVENLPPHSLLGLLKSTHAPTTARCDFSFSRRGLGDRSAAAPGSSSSPLFLNHPKLAPELERLGIRDLCAADRAHQVGPNEFAAGKCTAPIWYPLYGEGEHSKYDEGGLGYYADVHILAGIGNEPGGGGDIWIQDLWFRIDSVDDPPEDSIPFLVP